MTATLPCLTGHPLECEAAISDAVLKAARTAIERLGDPYKYILMADPGRLNRPVLPLLVALLDAAQAVATAMAENAWDDFTPINAGLAAGLVQQTQQIAQQIQSATHATPPAPAQGLGLPSMTGKELV